MNTLPAIVSAILSVLAADHGSIDLSPAQRVKEGTFERPPGSFAFACLCPPELIDSVPFGRGPDWYDETYQAEIRLWCPVADGTPEDRAEKSRLIQAEVQQALDNAKAGSNNTIWRTWGWAVRRTRPDPASPNVLPGWAHCRLTLEFKFKRRSGTGV